MEYERALSEVEEKLFEAIKTGDLKSVERCVEMGANVNVKDECNETPLLAAIGFNRSISEDKRSLEPLYLPIINFLLVHGARIDEPSSTGRTPLMIAIIYTECSGVVKLLLEKGSNVLARDEYNSTPLMFAVEVGIEKMVKLLLDKGAPVHDKDYLGRNALMCFDSYHYNRNVLDLLLSHGADINDYDNEGKTPLMYACKENNITMVQDFIAYGADVNAKDKWGKTVLMYAKETRNIETGRMIRKHSYPS